LSSAKRFFQNAVLVTAGILSALLFLELFFFRFVLPAPDVPRLDFVNGVIKYKPDQQGTNRVRNEITAAFRINASGWNSGHDRYVRTKAPGKYRIAVIGDSYVEARAVAFTDSLAEQLERLLGRQRCEVYRFGIRGAPLSQYLHILRREVADYGPDLVIILLIHNDFTESYTYMPGVYTSSFLKIAVENGRVVGEVPPQRMERRWYDFIRNRSAVWRYLAYRQQVRFQAVRDILLGDKARPEEIRQAHGTAAATDTRRTANEAVTGYVFRELRKCCRDHAADLLIAIDADRSSIYRQAAAGLQPGSRTLQLNRMAARQALRHSIHFIDLHPVFARDFAARHKRFDFRNDAHWNAYGHRVAAEALCSYILREGFIEEPR